MMSPLPGAWPEKPGSATLPFFGVVPLIVDDKARLWPLQPVQPFCLITPAYHCHPAHGSACKVRACGTCCSQCCMDTGDLTLHSRCILRNGARPVHSAFGQVNRVMSAYLTGLC